MSKQEEIIEVAGKKVVVRYTRDGFPCVKCVFNKTISLCQCIIDRCGEFDLEKDGDELAYFVEAEYPQEKDDREFCKNNCKGFRDTGGRCFADGDCKAKQEAESKVDITPESDFEAEYTRYMESRKDDVSGHAVTINIKDLARHFAEWERERIAARMRAALKKMNPGDVIACVLGWLKNSKNETIR